MQLLSQGCPLKAAHFKSTRSPYSLSLCAILFRLSLSGCPIQSVLFSLSHSVCPLQAVPFRLPPSGCFLQVGPFWLSFSGCPLRLFSYKAVPLRLSPSGCSLQSHKVNIQLLSEDCHIQAIPVCPARSPCSFSLRTAHFRLSL